LIEYSCLSLREHPPTHTHPLSLHDALPICAMAPAGTLICRGVREAGAHRGWPETGARRLRSSQADPRVEVGVEHVHDPRIRLRRSEEHTSELQSRGHLVCRLLLEKKKTIGE